MLGTESGSSARATSALIHLSHFSGLVFLFWVVVVFIVCLFDGNEFQASYRLTNIYSLNCIVSHYFIYVYLSVCLHVASMQVPTEPEESIGSLGVTGVYEMPDRVAEI